MDHLKGAYRRFGPSLDSWIASIGHQFEAGRPPPSRSTHIVPQHGSDGKQFSRDDLLEADDDDNRTISAIGFVFSKREPPFKRQTACTSGKLSDGGSRSPTDSSGRLRFGEHDCLANVADVRTHRSTGKRPVDAHAEEVPFLLPLPQHDYDTARVVYRLVDAEGLIQLDSNHYSAPWQLMGEILPVRVTETELILYDRQIQPLARHPLLRGQVGQRQTDPSHRPPRDHREQLEMLRQRFAELGEIGSRFLEGLLKKQRYAKHQASRVLALLQTYHRADLLAAMQRAVRYHAYALSSLERILALQATPKPSWQAFGADQQGLLERLTESDAIPPRSSAEYQHLLFEEKEPDDPPPGQEPPGTDPEAPADVEDPTER